MRKWLVALFILGAYSQAFATEAVEEDDGPQVNRSIESEGYHRYPFSVPVGSETASSLYQSANLASYPELRRAHRSTLIVNPSSSFELWIATWATFSENDPTAFFVPRSSGTYRDNVHQDLYMRYQAGASTGPVRGVVTTH